MSIHRLALLLYNCQVLLGSLSAISIAFLQSGSFEILRENFLLKNFCKSQLSSSFHFKAFEFFDFVVEIKDDISLLQQLSIMLLDVKLCCLLLLLSGRNHHSFIGSVNFKKNSHLLPFTIFPLFIILKPLILRISVFVIYQMIKDVAGIRHFYTPTCFEINFHVFRKACRQ